MADDQNPQDPAILIPPADQSASSEDTNRPDSTISANSQIAAPPPEESPSSPLPQDDSANSASQGSDTNWPNSTNPAISDPTTTDSAISVGQVSSVSTPSPPSTDEVQLEVPPVQPEVQPEINRPNSTTSAISDSANLNQPVSDQTDQTISAISTDQPLTASLTPQISSDQVIHSNSADLPNEPSILSSFNSANPSPDVPLISPPADQPPSPLPVSDSSQSIPPDSPVSDTSISLPTSPNQVPHVQSEDPIDTSNNEVAEKTEDLAEIKPEPLQSPAIPPIPPENISPPAPTISFGDILASTSNSPLPSSQIPPTDQTSSPPSQPSSSQPQITNDQLQVTSFGDLLKDSLQAEPTINIEPIEPPPISPSVSSPSIELPQNAPTPSPQNTQPPLPISPISPSVNIEEKLKEALSLRRQKANLVRTKKKEDMLNKLVELVKTRGKITNREAQLLLHLPQSTLTDYFKELVTSGRLKLFGRKRGIYYTI